MAQIYRRYLHIIAAAAISALLLIVLLLAPVSLAWPIVSGIAIAAFIGAGASLLMAVSLLRQFNQTPTDEEQYAALLESANDIIYTHDLAGNFLTVNPAVEPLLGYSVAEVLTMNIADVLPQEQLQVARQKMVQKVEGATTTVYELEVRAKDGRCVPFEISSRILMRDGQPVAILGIARDVRQRVEAVEALRASERRNKAILGAIPDTLVRIGPDNIIKGARWQIRPWTRVRPEQVIGQSVMRVIEMYDKSQRDTMYAFSEKLDAVRQSGEAQAVTFDFDNGSERRNFEARILPAGEGEVLAIFRDVTEEKREEAALQETQKLESIGVLAGGIAHDFNNLLTGILAQSSLAQARLPEGHPAHASLQKAVGAARRAADLTRQLLAYAGKGQFEIKAIDINCLVEENSGLFATMMPGTAVLTLDLAGDLAAVEMDEGQLQQVVMNLVINAAEAVREKGGEVRVTTGHRMLAPDTSGEGWIGNERPAPGPYVSLRVEDDGAGIDPDKVHRIFDPFYSTKAGGRGLGLAATLGIVRTAGGGVKVESVPGQGAAFEIYLPAATAVVPEARPAAPAPGTLQGGVLIIDDEEPVREAVHDILESVGMRVWAAPDGRAGLEAYQVHQAEIDLVLVDMQMPEMDGEATFWALHHFDPQVRVLLSSGYSAGELSRRFPENGPVTFLQKPYDRRRLLGVIRNALHDYDGVGE